MIPRLAVALLAALSASQCAAENVRVLSGEHEQFSRIVLVFREPIEWKPERTASGFSIAFNRYDLELDLSGIFDLIPRDRIEDVSFDSTSSTLNLGSDCGCEMDVFLAGKNTVAIDISSSTEPRSLTSTKTNGSAVADHLPFGLLYASRSQPKTRSIASSAARNLNSATTETGTNSDSQMDAPLRVRSDVETLETALMKQLGRAASQGLISAQMPQLPSDSAHSTLPAPAHTGAGANASHVLAGSVFDRHASVGDGVAPSGEHEKQTCIDPTLVDPALWSTKDTAEWLVGAARAETMNDLDVPEAEAVTRLVNTYLALGFGAEARAVIDEFPDFVPNSDILDGIASILDGMDEHHIQVFLGQEKCSGPPAIWGILANPDASKLGAVDVASIQDSFFRFPANLRQQLGPKLARNLMDAGHSDAASAVLNATRRSATVQSPELVVLEATTQISPRTKEAAQQKMSEVLSQDDAAAANALIEILTDAVRTGRINPEDALLAEAMASERRNTPHGNELLSAAAIARANLGEFHAAFQDHAEIGDLGNNDTAFDHVLSEIIEKIVQFEDDATLLRFLHRSQAGQATKNLSDDSIRRVARRLLEIDLSDEAMRILTTREPDTSVQGRELMARVALAENDPSLTLTILAGENHSEGLILRAKALSLLKNHSAASALFEERGDMGRAAHEAWLSGEPNRIRAVGLQAEVALATHLDTEKAEEANGPDTVTQKITLESSRLRVQGSKEMRGMLTTLLGDVRR